MAFSDLTPRPGAFASYPSLKGKVVFITGGGSGIGAAMVTAFTGQGAKVAFVDVDDKASKALVTSLGKAPPMSFSFTLPGSFVTDTLLGFSASTIRSAFRRWRPAVAL